MNNDLRKQILLKVKKYGEIKSINNHLILKLNNLSFQLEEEYVINSFSSIDLFRSIEEFTNAFNWILKINNLLNYSNKVLIYKDKKLIKVIKKNAFLIPSTINKLSKHQEIDDGFNYIFLDDSHYVKIDELNIKKLLKNTGIDSFKAISDRLNLNANTFRTKLSRDSFTYKEWLKIKHILTNKTDITKNMNIKEYKERL